MNYRGRASVQAAAALVMALAAGCSDEPAASDPSGGGAAGGSGTPAGGAGGGGGDACPAGSHAGPTGGCESTLAGWTDGPALTQARDHHLSFVAVSESAGFVYAAGGVEDNATLFDDIEVSAIQPDGSLGPWAEAGKLPGSTAGAGVAVVGSTVVITGGYRLTSGGNPTLSSATDVGRVMPDGTIGTWVVGPKLGQTRFHHAMVVDGSNLFVLGGLTGDNTDNTPRVERATVGDDGVVGEWTEVTPLPKKRSHHSAAVHAGAIYVTGGLEGNPAGSHTSLVEVLRAVILEDGSLGEWTQVGELSVSLTTPASFTHQGALYVVGGIEGDATNTSAVRRAALGEDGTLGPWEEVAALPKARAHAHQTPVYQGFVYAVAGAYNHNSIADVFIGRFE